MDGRGNQTHNFDIVSTTLYQLSHTFVNSLETGDVYSSLSLQYFSESVLELLLRGCLVYGHQVN